MPIPEDTQAISRRSARGVVLDRLVGWIEEGLLVPGELIKDGELAAQLGVSRTPVREALQILEQRGLVEMRPGRLTRVTEATPEDIEHVMAPLAALQAVAAEFGTPRAAASDIQELEAHNEDLLRAVKAGNPVEAAKADRAFHAVFVRLAANPHLDLALEPLMSHIRRLEALYFRDEQPATESYAEHKAIIKAVRAGDAAAAADVTGQNFKRIWRPKPAEASPRSSAT